MRFIILGILLLNALDLGVKPTSKVDNRPPEGPESHLLHVTKQPFIGIMARAKRALPKLTTIIIMDHRGLPEGSRSDVPSKPSRDCSQIGDKAGWNARTVMMLIVISHLIDVQPITGDPIGEPDGQVGAPHGEPLMLRNYHVSPHHTYCRTSRIQRYPPSYLAWSDGSAG